MRDPEVRDLRAEWHPETGKRGIDVMPANTPDLAPVIELGSTRFCGPIMFDACDSLREAVELARDLVAYNDAYPCQIRVDGVVRWARFPDEHMNFKWRRVAPESSS